MGENVVLIRMKSAAVCLCGRGNTNPAPILSLRTIPQDGQSVSLQMEKVMGFFIYTHPPPFKDNFPFGKIEALKRRCG